MDAPWAYRWWNYKRYINPKDVEKMRRNMKKVPLIESKADRYHLKEEQEAEELLSSRLPTNNNDDL